MGKVFCIMGKTFFTMGKTLCTMGKTFRIARNFGFCIIGKTFCAMGNTFLYYVEDRLYYREDLCATGKLVVLRFLSVLLWDEFGRIWDVLGRVRPFVFCEGSRHTYFWVFIFTARAWVDSLAIPSYVSSL